MAEVGRPNFGAYIVAQCISDKGRGVPSFRVVLRGGRMGQTLLKLGTVAHGQRRSVRNVFHIQTTQETSQSERRSAPVTVRRVQSMGEDDRGAQQRSLFWRPTTEPGRFGRVRCPFEY
uniref:Uncharacterized protein n=1 Tax=Cacopsylla melanoneura TaxID=428564 RepID=A0A8D8VCI4_9HEMI